MLRARFLTIFTLIASLCCTAANFDDLSRRADHFFDNSEWASAAACYNFMLQEEPTRADIYGRDIVANLMLNDTVQSQQLLKNAMGYKVPMDSVLAQVRTYSFKAGHSDLYEKFMLNTAHANQWLSRPLDQHLLKYYIFRCNAPKIVEYSNRMLAGNPDNISYLTTLAQGYLLQGKGEAALDTWQRILTLNPDDYSALINAASYLSVTGDKAQADQYYARAQRLRPTPYVASRLADAR